MNIESDYQRDRILSIISQRETLIDGIGTGQIKTNSSLENDIRIERVRDRVRTSTTRLRERLTQIDETEGSETSLLTRAMRLQIDALRVIDQLELPKNLSRIGNPSLIGSVNNGLMVWRDIDYEVYVDEYRFGDYVDFISQYARMPGVVEVGLTDFSVKNIRESHTKGVYTHMLFQDPSQNEWKVDVWFLDFVPPDRSYEDLLKKATREEVESILNIKNKMYKSPLYKGYIISVDIYKAVLEGHVRNFEEFGEYMRLNSKDVTLQVPPDKFEPS